jgi:hypothetical protein
LAPDRDTVFAEHDGNASLGDAVASADLLGGLASFVASHDVGYVLGAQEAFGTGFRFVLIQ